MNGRIYDPKLGRMLQADPFVQNPKNSQSLNRYSYVLNNPLSYTDPSGYFSLKGLLKFGMKVSGSWYAHKFLNNYPVISGVISAGLNFIPGCQVWCSAVFNAHASFVATGSVGQAFKSGAISAAAGYALQGIAASNLTLTQQVLAAGAVGGIAAELQGGKFGHGFISAGLGYGIGMQTRGAPSPGRFIAATVAGGTISKITGGKFANGAISAAMSYAIAAMASRNQNGGRDLTTTKASEMTDEEFEAVFGMSEEWVAFESSPFLRATVPGQIQWDYALTEFENGNYSLALAHAGAMLAEQGVTVATFGYGTSAIHSIRAFSPGMVGRYFGPQGPVFGTGFYRGAGNSGLLNHGPVRLGWSFQESTGRLNFSLRIGKWHSDRYFNPISIKPPPR